MLTQRHVGCVCTVWGLILLSRGRDDFELINFIPFLLYQAAATTVVECDREFSERHDLAGSECFVIFALGADNHMTATEICDKLNMHKTKVSRAATSLEAKGLLHREMLEHDRRKAILSLSDAGRLLWHEIAKAAKAYEITMLKDTTKEEREILTKFLRRFARLPD